MSNNSTVDENVVKIDIDGNLDLHNFNPKDIGSLIPEYLRECIKKELYHVRIIHGKGIGNLRRGVHSVLEKSSYVKSYVLADETSGSWGATLVELRKETEITKKEKTS